MTELGLDMSPQLVAVFHDRGVWHASQQHPGFSESGNMSGVGFSIL